MQRITSARVFPSIAERITAACDAGSLAFLVRMVDISPIMSAAPEIQYRVGNNLDLDAMIELYVASTLGERRPLGDRERMRCMLDGANLVITAWEGDLMVGIARSISDFSYATYLSDLAVRESHQRRGIGRELIRRTRREAPTTRIVLLSAPKATTYYPHIGMEQHPSAWTLAAEREN